MGNPSPPSGPDPEIGSAPSPAAPSPAVPSPAVPSPAVPGQAGYGAAEPHRTPTGSSVAVTVGCYAVLLLLGIAEGVIGAFQYSRGIGAFPVAAIGFALLVLFTCVLASWGMRTPSAGLIAAGGWFVAVLVLAMTTPGGSIVITNTASGKWFLFGGAACAAAGVVAGFAKWPSARKARRYGPPSRKPGR